MKKLSKIYIQKLSLVAWYYICLVANTENIHELQNDILRLILFKKIKIFIHALVWKRVSDLIY